MPWNLFVSKSSVGFGTVGPATIKCILGIFVDTSASARTHCPDFKADVEKLHKTFFPDLDYTMTENVGKTADVINQLTE